MNDRAVNPLAREFTAASLLKFAFPTMITMIFMGFYTIGDTIFVSRFVNTDALSAINVVTPVINLIVGLGTMLAAGGSAITARKMGAGKEREASQDFTLIVSWGPFWEQELPWWEFSALTRSSGGWELESGCFRTAGIIC